LEQGELSLKSRIDDEQSKVTSLEVKLKDAIEKRSALEESERLLKSEFEDNRDKLELSEARLKKAESSIATLNQNEAMYKETIETESTRFQQLQAKLNEAMARIAALEVVEQTVKTLKDENERLQETAVNLDAANDTIAAMRKKEVTLKGDLAIERQKLEEAMQTIEELEKRPATGIPADGTSVLSGLNDMEIVIDEENGKMKVIITKRRQVGTDGEAAFGPVEKFILN